MSSALLVGALLAVLSLAYVLYPLVSSSRNRTRAAAESPRQPRRGPVTDDEIEDAIRAYRTTHIVGDRCPVCGPRPESDAVFCSNCGRRLAGQAG